MIRKDATLKGGAPSTDLLVCFPHRVQLTVMPAKATCSPGRPSDHPCPTRRRDKSSFNRKVPRTSPSPVWVKAKHIVAAVTSEPTSPKVTCAGQIKIKNKNCNTTIPSKGWKSGMHEIERSHKEGNRKKQSTSGEALGFNKDVIQFLTCLRSLKFNFRCFGNFPIGEITSDDDEEEGRNKEEDDGFRDTDRGNRDGGGGNGDGEAFSKLFVVLEEDTKINSDDHVEGEVPPNALLLMRCRSAPAKTWSVEADGIKRNDDSESRVGTIKKNLKILMEEEKKVEEEEGRKKAEGLVTASLEDMNYYGISTDIARETWILGGFREVLSKSRSWKI